MAEVIERELRTIARMHFAGERTDHTLQPTALVNEAWVRLAAREDCHFADLTAFRSWASRAIRLILVDHARRKLAAKRGGGWTRHSLAIQVSKERSVDVMELHEALESLERRNSRAARLVEMRFFAGMTSDEAARELGVSPRQAGKLWASARTLLYGFLVGGTQHDDEAG